MIFVTIFCNICNEKKKKRNKMIKQKKKVMHSVVCLFNINCLKATRTNAPRNKTKIQSRITAYLEEKI